MGLNLAMVEISKNSGNVKRLEQVGNEVEGNIRYVRGYVLESTCRERKRREEKRRKEGYLVPRGSLAGRLATAATAEGGQRKQQRRRRWLEGLLRPPY